jgi:cytoskeletal protein CcmA (bactofilin family)
MFFRKQKANGHANHDKAFGNDNLPPPSEATLIARGTRIDGNVASEGEVRIEGEVNGTVDAAVCTIAEDGRVEGEVVADDVYVQGTVRGPIKARHVHLMAEGTVEGDISCETIAIETGARLSGAVWQGQGRDAAEEPLPKLAQDKNASLFSGSLWPDHGDDGYRPLAAVKPIRALRS